MSRRSRALEYTAGLRVHAILPARALADLSVSQIYNRTELRLDGAHVPYGWVRRGTCAALDVSAHRRTARSVASLPTGRVLSQHATLLALAVEPHSERAIVTRMTSAWRPSASTYRSWLGCDLSACSHLLKSSSHQPLHVITQVRSTTITACVATRDRGRRQPGTTRARCSLHIQLVRVPVYKQALHY
jgi:hypothetical protein